ncbi:MAG: uroporphyrinogen-III C-methyltransferase [Methylobacteriaceae bacterium]|nr:uroporphyrinogen-III C-methyltransferase [Methylobacteriaceae bacterium]
MTGDKNESETRSVAAGAPLATLPVFFKLSGRRCVVAGGGDGAAWKTELLASAGAPVDVYAAEPCERLERLAAGLAGVRLHRRAWTAADLAGALIAVAEAESDHAAQAFRADARAAGAIANVIDRPAFCDFQFGSMVNRSPLVVGISTDGAAPVFGQALRARIETLAPEGFAAWAGVAREWRADIAALDLPFRARRRFWEEFAELAFARPGVAPTIADLQALLAVVSDEAVAAARRGKVVLVGAGPGDPELLTLKAVRALQSADVVLYDDLVSPGVLDFARREAEKLDVGKRGYRPSPGQPGISAKLVELAAAGKTVVRLKGGDPMIFGRATEEIEALQAAGLDVEVIPGVTAASGAAASLRASLTERDLARRVQYVTAHGRDGALPEDLDWRALADPGATTVVYMGVRTLSALVDKLQAAGLDPTTPAILVDRATWPDERRIVATLATIGPAVERAAPAGPCLLILGAALSRPAGRLQD